MMPRLKQPLYIDQILKTCPREIVLAYDTLWTQTYRPPDITPEKRGYNSRIALEMLGHIIETACGSDVFDFDPRQMSFPDEVLDNNHAPQAQKEI